VGRQAVPVSHSTMVRRSMPICGWFGSRKGAQADGFNSIRKQAGSALNALADCRAGGLGRARFDDMMVELITQGAAKLSTYQAHQPV